MHCSECTRTGGRRGLGPPTSALLVPLFAFFGTLSRCRLCSQSPCEQGCRRPAARQLEAPQKHGPPGREESRHHSRGQAAQQRCCRGSCRAVGRAGGTFAVAGVPVLAAAAGRHCDAAPREHRCPTCRQPSCRCGRQGRSAGASGPRAARSGTSQGERCRRVGHLPQLGRPCRRQEQWACWIICGRSGWERSRGTGGRATGCGGSRGGGRGQRRRGRLDGCPGGPWRGGRGRKWRCRA